MASCPTPASSRSATTSCARSTGATTRRRPTPIPHARSSSPTVAASSLGSALEGEVDAAPLAGDRVIATGSAAEPALAIVELPSGKNVASIMLTQYAGTRIMPWGKDHIVALDGRPRVISLATGEIVQ